MDTRRRMLQTNHQAAEHVQRVAYSEFQEPCPRAVGYPATGREWIQLVSITIGIWLLERNEEFVFSRWRIGSYLTALPPYEPVSASKVIIVKWPKGDISRIWLRSIFESDDVTLAVPYLSLNSLLTFNGEGGYPRYETFPGQRGTAVSLKILLSSTGFTYV